MNISDNINAPITKIDVEETEDNFEGNAILKAVEISKRFNCHAVATDDAFSYRHLVIGGTPFLPSDSSARRM